MRTIASRPIYENRWIRLREDDFERPDGSLGLYAVVDKPPCAGVIALHEGHIVLIEQYRYPIGRRSLEIPQGALEDSPDADPIEIARTELREETGYLAESMTRLGELYPAAGLLNQLMTIFLAEQLVVGPRELETTEQDLVVSVIAIDEFRAMIRRGEIVDGCTLGAWALYEATR